ncbi:MAG: hypothetical protein ABSF80_12305 [Chitinispirillaceae bacterium]|jgi:hypothetical protein
MQTDPREHFQYPACFRCFERPCTALRFHHQYGDRFLFVHNAQYNTLNPCPFAADTFDEANGLFADCDLHELDQHLRGLMAQMTPDELLRVNKDHFMESYLDRAGRMAYLRRLWEERIFAVIRVPQALRQDEKMKEWFKE